MGDNVTPVPGSGTIAVKTVGNSKPVTTNITLGGTDAENYTLTQPTTVTANIVRQKVPKPVVSPAVVE